ncbi:MAG: endolytic transglycosylase MltG, partial [Angustibacter sp.]
GQTLQEAGVVKTTKAFVVAAGQNPKSGGIQPGAYVLRSQMSAAAAIEMLLDPKVRAAGQVLIREGLRATEIFALLAKATKQPAADYAAAVKNPAALGLPAEAKGKVEGWLFPGTYAFTSKTTAAEQLKTMIDQTKKVLSGLSVATGSAQRALIIASIAQVEAAKTEDFAKVARVVENRLDNKLGNGSRLQLDSTVSYAVGKRSLLTTAAERNTASPYNTYRYGGLPAGPISNPSKAALTGALKPATGDWLFFVTTDPTSGETKFANTLTEHNANVAVFQKWCRENPDQC